MDELLAALDPASGTRQSESRSLLREPLCPCSRNPLLAYFAAGHRAVQEGLILAQVTSTLFDPREHAASLDELNAALDRISRREIEAFCGVCQPRALAVQP